MKNYLLDHLRWDERVARGLLTAVAILLGVWLLAVWIEPFSLPQEAALASDTEVPPARSKLKEVSFYNVISDKDVFSPARTRYVKPKPVVKAVKEVHVEPPPPPPRRPPPRLTLLGTIILNNSEAALIEHVGVGAPNYYRVGDNIEEFVIVKIQKDFVMLDRDGEGLRIVMNQSAQHQNLSGNNVRTPQQINTTGAPADIPSGLVPRKRQ